MTEPTIAQTARLLTELLRDHFGPEFDLRTFLRDWLWTTESIMGHERKAAVQRLLAVLEDHEGGV